MSTISICLTERSVQNSFIRSSRLVVMVITTGLQKILKVSDFVQFAIQTDNFEDEGGL